MTPTLAEQVITLMVVANDLPIHESRKTDLIIILCIFIGMVTFFAFMARGQIRSYNEDRRNGWYDGGWYDGGWYDGGGDDGD